MAVYVYAPGADDFDSMGLCGPLTPTKCEFTEKRNGLSQLVMDHPIDDYSRWAMLVPGCVLKADVPVRTTPEIDGTALVTTVEKWKFKTTATEGQRKLWSKSSGGRLIKKLPVWADKARTQRFEVTVVRKGSTRYKAKTKFGSGWIPLSGLEYSVTNTIENNPAAIETVEPAWTVKPQLFRIREAAVTDTGVTVTASHIFYDLAGNITTWSGYVEATDTNNPTCAAALAGVLGGCVLPHEFEGYTNLTDQRVNVAWTRVNAVEALLAPDTGLVDRWGVELVRDNYEFYLLREAGKNRGVRIEYGKNLLGVECTTDITSVIARIMPVGKTNKGKPLFLTAGTYTVNGTTVTIAAGETWVTSPQAGDYAAPLMEVLDTNIKAKSSDSDDVLAARKKMIEAALNKFADDQCDQPSVNLKVDFVNLGDTVEYEQYKRLDDVYLCDRVRVRHPGIKVDVLTEVIETVWDCLTGRFRSVELGRVQLERTRIKTPVWQLPAGIPGTLFAPGTVDAGAVADDFGRDVDMTGNESVQAIAQEYVKNAWITGEQVFKYAAGASTPTPASIIVSANLQNVLMDRWQYKNCSGIWTDYPVGDGNVTITSTALVVKPGHGVWVDDVCTLKLLTDDVNISDTFCLYKVSDGATGDTGATGAAGLHGLTAILSNAAHTLPKTTDGAITYTGSGTTLRLFEGGTELAYDGAGVNNGTWKVDTTASGITCGSLTDSGLYLTVGNHSAMTGNTAKVIYAITGKRQNGTAFSLTVEQSLSVAQQGATGTPAVVLTVYAPNGSVFTNQVGTLLLSAVGYSGANQITSGATYQWKKYTGGSWVTISGATASTLSVSGSDVAGLQAYKCEMTYGGVVYSGTITLTDKTDNYQAAISSTGGDTFRNGVGSSAMACRLWQNGAEADALKSAVISETAPSSPVTGQFYYKITPNTPQVALMRWSGSAWVDVTTNPTYAHEKSYTWYRLDKDGNALDGGAAFATGKVIYVDGDDVDVQTTWECEVA